MFEGDAFATFTSGKVLKFGYSTRMSRMCRSDMGTGEPLFWALI
jgi:hypothetical protein